MVTMEIDLYATDMYNVVPTPQVNHSHLLDIFPNSTESTNTTNGTYFARDENIAIIEVAVCATILFLAVGGNSCVIFSLATKRKRLSRMHLMILHLSLADLFVAFFNVLPQLAWDITYRFEGGPFMCVMVKYLQVVAMYASSYVLLAAAVDRFYAICHPFASQSWTAKHAHTLAVIAWSASLIFSIPQVFIFSLREVQPGSEVIDCWARFDPLWTLQAYITWMTASIFVVPTCVLGILYGQITWVVWKAGKLENKRIPAKIPPPPIMPECECRRVDLDGYTNSVTIYKFHQKTTTTTAAGAERYQPMRSSTPRSSVCSEKLGSPKVPKNHRGSSPKACKAPANRKTSLCECGLKNGARKEAGMIDGRSKSKPEKAAEQWRPNFVLSHSRCNGEDSGVKEQQNHPDIRLKASRGIVGADPKWKCQNRSIGCANQSAQAPLHDRFKQNSILSGLDNNALKRQGRDREEAERKGNIIPNSRSLFLDSECMACRSCPNTVTSNDHLTPAVSVDGNQVIIGAGQALFQELMNGTSPQPHLSPKQSANMWTDQPKVESALSPPNIAQQNLTQVEFNAKIDVSPRHASPNLDNTCNQTLDKESRTDFGSVLEECQDKDSTNGFNSVTEESKNEETVPKRSESCRAKRTKFAQIRGGGQDCLATSFESFLRNKYANLSIALFDRHTLHGSLRKQRRCHTASLRHGQSLDQQRSSSKRDVKLCSNSEHSEINLDHSNDSWSSLVSLKLSACANTVGGESPTGWPIPRPSSESSEIAQPNHSAAIVADGDRENQQQQPQQLHQQVRQLQQKRQLQHEELPTQALPYTNASSPEPNHDSFSERVSPSDSPNASHEEIDGGLNTSVYSDNGTMGAIARCVHCSHSLESEEPVPGGSNRVPPSPPSRSVFASERDSEHRASIALQGKVGISRAKLKTIKMTLTVVICYVLCWAPFFGGQMWAAYDETAPYDGTLFSIIMLLASMNSCTNPWIYTIFSNTICQRTRRLLRRPCQCFRPCRERSRMAWPWETPVKSGYLRPFPDLEGKRKMYRQPTFSTLG